ncbi:MAG: hypothetical protein A3D31_08390 [Candidatus Fluviicola riflensis]|nr:MAG: hypothetical protein CHH17_06610 [Candidatus Fluviicola riflensis]OGS79958.1 MAG: hypothetical protein A3D31_08390 [Candidatus Fluviicola riflensis]OGS82473.1 MAG: hypothetical protein A2724_17335 [Fluviicola sp. RIFCSPHIGHO2_01_FULL_43_53]OGS88137.1 MAG: hypothetical protein A3E30_14770 [Fluviicola sp. RIFCSPHIGHO2_12_FULL_43_24]
MTPENKKVVKIIAVSVGIILVLSVITILIIKQVQKGREEREASRISDGGDSAPSKSSSGTSGGGSSTGSFGGRTFSKAEIEKMQSYLFNMGAMAMNETIVSAIRDTGGIDGRIGTGFKTAYNEAIRIGIIHSLDELYSEAMKH